MTSDLLPNFLPPETNQTVEAEQYWCGSRNRVFGPLALGFNSDVGAHSLKSDLHFPVHCEDRDDFGWVHIGDSVGIEERRRAPILQRGRAPAPIGLAFVECRAGTTERCWR